MKGESIEKLLSALRAFGVFALLALPTTALGQGIYLPASGPVHRGMAGASTAAPIDALGAMYWNPATISGLQRSEVSFGLDLLLSDYVVSSSVGPFGGSTGASEGVLPIPNIAWVHHLEESPLSFGVGLNLLAGWGTYLPADATNPILSPPPNGFGRIYAEANYLQLAPVISACVTENLSIAVGPTITMGKLDAVPFAFDSPNADGTYPLGAGRWHWGGGFQVGAFYSRGYWHFGASFKSPAWMERFELLSETAAGTPRTVGTRLDLPPIVSVGASYTGIQDMIWALDVRMLDYDNTAGFGDPAGFGADGALQGLGWKTVVSVALGAEYRLTECLAARAGYSYTQSPVTDQVAFFNIASPLQYQNAIYVGGSFRLSENAEVNMAYNYVPEETVTGPLHAPGVGPLPGTSVSNSVVAHLISIGGTVRY